MKYSGKLTINTKQYSDGDINRINSEYDCTIEFFQDTTVIEYKESISSENDTLCTLSLSDDTLIIDRNGDIQSKLIIKEGVRYNCEYKSEVGAFDLSVIGKKLICENKTGRFTIRAYYYLGLGGGDILNKVEIIIRYGDKEND